MGNTLYNSHTKEKHKNLYLKWTCIRDLHCQFSLFFEYISSHFSGMFPCFLDLSCSNLLFAVNAKYLSVDSIISNKMHHTQHYRYNKIISPSRILQFFGEGDYCGIKLIIS